MGMKPLGQMLIEAGFITEEQLEIALKEQKRTGEKLGEILLRMGFVTREDILKVLSRQWGVPYIDLKKAFVDPNVIKLVPEETAREHKLIPIEAREGTLVVAMANPNDIYANDLIESITGYKVEPRLSDEESIFKAIEVYYGVAKSPDQVIEESVKLALTEETAEGTPPIAQLVDMIVIKAAIERATDIHIEPDERVVRVRYRIDGILRSYYTLPRKIYGAVATRVKIIAGLDISEQRVPQDGAFTIPFGLKEIAIRVSTYPTIYGESIVMRLLNKASLLSLDQLGFSEDHLKVLRRIINKPYGMVVVTGPTGSGKTTTLYSILSVLNALEKNIMTVEDPSEYRIPLIKQSQVNEKAGFTFAKALRAILRHDPDVILIGEMRDRETAEMGFRAAMTGHLVFSTVHANTAAAAIPRLIDMGIEPFIVASSLLAVIAQRLVRRICPRCKEEYKPDRETLQLLGLREDEGPFFRGKGCEYCKNSGYKGRIGIYEILEITPEIAKMIAEKASAYDIERAAGLKKMKEDGIEKAKAGITTLDEILRVVG
ncbi:MAG: Flp pilus assembly complex ATPase component TadA [Candidatus Hydrothermae bacterium]|nr:Flp pilus assembly complex ATPase component TadA [Candidatus Hydrothermae bacterium]